MVDLAQRFEVEGFSLAWDVWGGSSDAAPLVIVHGFGGSVHDFAGHIERLAEGRPVFAIDHRGHGRSSRSGDEATYTIDHIVDDVVAWITAEIGRPVHILGHSMGGRVAIRLAQTRRDLVQSLVLANTTAWTFGDDREIPRDVTVAFFESLQPDTVMGGPPVTEEDELIVAAASQAWLVTREEIRAAFDPMAAKALGVALFGDRLQPVAHQLGDIDCPVTVLAGSNDHPYCDHAAELAALVTNGRAIVIGGAYHSPQLTHPGRWQSEVADHLAWAGD